jgi:S-DNA-T family DNA segregation ATPase FtsK/SpoIIIE
MNILGPTPLKRLNEAVGLVCLAAALFTTLALISYYPQDPSWNTATSEQPVRNLVGWVGAHLADLAFQAFGLSAFALPLFLVALAWKWIRSAAIEAQGAKVVGVVLFWLSASALFGLGPDWRVFEDSVPPGGLVGLLLAEWLASSMNFAGAVLVAATTLLVAIYLVSSFSLYHLPAWVARPGSLVAGWSAGLGEWLPVSWRRKRQQPEPGEATGTEVEIVAEPALLRRRSETLTPATDDDIPIRTLDDATAVGAGYAPVTRFDDEPVASAPEVPVVEYTPPPPSANRPPWEDTPVAAVLGPELVRTPARTAPVSYRMPPTSLLNEPDARSPYDTQELKDTATRIKQKFEEFNVLGNVVQINPGPVVTTFEFRPEAGIKYNRITALTEDLCLGLQAESILIERIPGKPTVGIEVPNARRETIALRQILESDEFQSSTSKLTIALGKDISGRIKVAPLETMPHLLIAGSTGSGKSVMLNSLIMSVLYKATPAEVRMILIDPKRVEMGLYEDIPHLLTPVITDPRKATNTLRNAVLEMERRLKLLASQGVRNIEQFNKKVRQKLPTSRSLFDDDGEFDELQPLSYILIVIDELADLMMIERANVEESITRLAQMARAVGMHLVVATQRPSVDVITGLIKANFPARVSFRVATRVDSRTILDVMGAEHLLGKGDMLFLPPGSGRLVRVHAPYVSESEISQVTEFWKDQASPDYDQSYLLAPPSDDEDGDADDLADFNDPAYEDAVRVVVEVGKASTSVLQRRLRLGYGRAARILDKMHRDGIIGPPDGPRPRDVLRRPDWLDDIKEPVR